MTLDMGESMGEGEQMFDVGTGLLRSSTVRLTIPMSMSGNGPDGPLNMQTNVKSTTTTEMVK